MKTKFLTTIITLLITSLIVVNAQNSQDKYVDSKGEAAFAGYDLVSYFQGQKPQKGLPQYQFEYDGLKLNFASADNMALFKTDPEKYLPAYGGYCATAICNKVLLVPDFSNFQIQDGRLLFFETRAFFNGKTAWNKDPDLNEILADRFYRQKFGSDGN